MEMADQEPGYTPVTVRGRDIHPPLTISAEARQVLSNGAANPGFVWPPASDKAAWKARAEAPDPVRQKMAEDMIANANATIETTEIAGVICYDCLAAGQDSANAPVYLFVHGGAFVSGGGDFAKGQGARNADGLGLRCISVDYRMPPDHPFPAAPEDVVAVYRSLIEQVDPARIVLGGASAGGNIAASATLMIRDRGLPPPAGVVLLTPEVDLTESGDTFQTNEMLDTVLKRGLPEANALYADGHDLTDPYLSPLFADFALGFPPTLIQSGTRDLFLSNSVLIHRALRKAGIAADLHVWEAMPHGGFLLGTPAPENDEIRAEVSDFIRRVIG